MSLSAPNINFRTGKPTGKELEVKTYGFGGHLRSLIEIGDHTLSHDDFCVIVEYFLTNTSLIDDNDPRLALVRKIKSMRKVRKEKFKSTYLEPKK